MASAGSGGLGCAVVLGVALFIVMKAHWGILLLLTFFAALIVWALNYLRDPLPERQEPTGDAVDQRDPWGNTDGQPGHLRPNEDKLIAGLLTGDPQVASIKLYRSDLRLVQILGESARLVTETKNEKTRESRMKDVYHCHAQLKHNVGGEVNFSDESWAMIKARVEEARTESVYWRIAAPALKAIAQGQRYTKPETKRRYFMQALELLASATHDGTYSPAIAQRLKALNETATSALAQLDGSPDASPSH